MASSSAKAVVVRDVWASNAESEFALIRQILPRYRHAAIDTEFPGVVYAPKKKPSMYYSQQLPPPYNYRLMKANVDATKIIQIGLALSDDAGNLPDLGTNTRFVWQFNFMDFDIERDLFNPASIALLKQQGIDFVKNKAEGIPSETFRKLFVSSGLLFNMMHVTWATFHGCSDFGYLIKILIGTKLPRDIASFSYLVWYFFGPNVYDMKHMVRFCNGLTNGGLEKLAKSLKVDRVAGRSHQAGSDSLLTLQTFFRLTDTYFNFKNITAFRGILYGLEPPLWKIVLPYAPFRVLVRAS